MHSFDRQTDGQTERKAFVIPCVALHMQSPGKKRKCTEIEATHYVGYMSIVKIAAVLNGRRSLYR